MCRVVEEDGVERIAVAATELKGRGVANVKDAVMDIDKSSTKS